MQTADIYWRKTRQLTVCLLLLWMLVTFGINWFARELQVFTLFDFPLGFYMGAQGELIIYLAMIWFYNRRMRQLEAQYGIVDE